MNDSFIFWERSVLSLFCSQKTSNPLDFTLFLAVFHWVSPFYVQAQIKLLFAPLFFFKEPPEQSRLEKSESLYFVLSITKIKDLLEEKKNERAKRAKSQCGDIRLFTARANCSLTKSNVSDLLVFWEIIALLLFCSHKRSDLLEKNCSFHHVFDSLSLLSSCYAQEQNNPVALCFVALF